MLKIRDRSPSKNILQSIAAYDFVPHPKGQFVRHWLRRGKRDAISNIVNPIF